MVYTDGIMALSEPEYGDDADIAVINSNSVKIDDHMTNAFNNLAEPFNPNKAYEVGEIVVYEKVTYIFIVAKSAGAWDATKVEVKPLGTAIFEKEGGAGSLSDLTDTDIDTPAEGEVLTWDGEKWVNAEGTPAVTKTVTGNPIEFTDGADAPLVKCTTAIQGNQDLHGYDKPWVGGAGKNQSPMMVDGIKRVNRLGTWSGNTYTLNGITFTILTDSSENVIGIKAHGLANDTVDFIPMNNYFTLPANSYILNGCSNGSSGTYRLNLYKVISDGNELITQSLNGDSPSFTLSGDENLHSHLYISQGVQVDTVIYPMIRLASVSDPTFAPYSNICPITAYNQSTISVEDENEVVQQTSTATLSQSIYQGNADFVGESETADWVKLVFDGSADESWSYGGSPIFFFIDVPNGVLVDDTTQFQSDFIISNMYKTKGWATKTNSSVFLFYGQSRICVRDDRFSTVADWKTYLSNNNLEIAYKLATPTTETITPTNLPIKSLFGYNHIESSTGEMEVEYITENYQPLVDLIQNSKHVYSTQEQVVGKWVDGKDVYEKTYTFSSLPAVSDWTAFDEDCEIDTLVDYSCMYTRSNGQTDNNSDLLRVAYNPPNALGDLCYYPGGVGATHITVRYTKATATTRNLSKGTTDGLKAEISEVKDEGEEILKGDEKALKIDESEDTETKETDETEGNADEVQNETVTE